MLILALDTTTRAGSCALARDGEIVGVRASDPDQPPAARLPGDLMGLLAECAVSLSDVDAFAVAIGPGSFTGLRIGIATMQGLAFSTEKPLFGVSGLDALAAATVPEGTTGAVATWVDAWRGEVYASLYEGREQVEPPTVASPAALVLSLASRLPDREVITFVGDGVAAFRDHIVQVFGDRARVADPVNPLLAAHLALLAGARLARGERPLPHDVAPLYVRRPDAELVRDRR